MKVEVVIDSALIEWLKSTTMITSALSVTVPGAGVTESTSLSTGAQPARVKLNMAAQAAHFQIRVMA